MGNCCSTELLEATDLTNAQLADQTTIQTAVRLVKYGFWNRKKILIYNSSTVHASFAITAGPIRNLTSLTIDKVGGITFDKTGKDKVQKFKLLSRRPRYVRIHSNYFFVTVYLLIDNEWKQLWVNREFYQHDNISIQEYHIEEASINEMVDDDVDE